MRLENVLALTHGSLLSQPDISLFNDIVIEAKRVKRGSLFIALNPYEIPQALENGAYGIVFDRALHTHDDETAWIKVDDIYEALKRLMRFLLIDKELSAFTCKPVILHIAKQLITPNTFIILEGSLSENFTKLLDAPQKSTLLFVDTDIQSNLFTEASQLPEALSHHIEIREQTLFETAFIYKGVFYERQLISAFFIPYLEQILELLSLQHIDFKIRPFVNLPHFQAKFVTKALHVKDFGSTDQVLIFERDDSLIKEEMVFIHRQAPWADTICLLPSESDIKLDTALYYADDEELLEILRNRAFHYALVLADPSVLERQKSTPAQQTLF